MRSGEKDEDEKNSTKYYDEKIMKIGIVTENLTLILVHEEKQVPY